ncbi:type II toxin-antitoxin system Phd/YefM family antitoxin [Porticoccaceae bacterium]|nr:type II toxin-antitoxin system Phd/YefM family antitoxin [Porticoccaceae bacterium]
MEIINAREAKNGFGDVLLKAQSGPIGINKNGKPVAVVISADEYAKIEFLRDEILQRELEKGLAAIKAGHVRDGADVVQELRAHYFDDKL